MALFTGAFFVAQVYLQEIKISLFILSHIKILLIIY